MFNLSIEMANAAFADNPQAEVARILRFVADEIEETSCPMRGVYDANGNRVGSWDVNCAEGWTQ